MISAQKQKQLEALKYKMEVQLPANEILGAKIIDLKEGFVKLEIPFKKEFIGSFKQGFWFGGILSAIADWAGATVGSSVVANNDILLNTVDMRIKYLKPALENIDIFCEATVLSYNDKLIRVAIKLYQNTDNNIVTEVKSLFVVIE